MKYKIFTRDWKGSYSIQKKYKGWRLFGCEDDIETGGDCWTMIFCNGNPKKSKYTSQEIWDANEQFNEEDEFNGLTWVKGEDNEVEEINRRK